MLEKIRSEFNFLKVNVGTLADENIKRVREIATIGWEASVKDASMKSQNLPDTKPEEREGGNKTEPTHTLTNDQEGAERSV